jgi:hypothetical protein
VLLTILYILLVVCVVVVLAIAVTMWLRVRKLTAISRTQFLRRVKDPADETSRMQALKDDKRPPPQSPAQ